MSDELQKLALTSARIALGLAGSAIPTREQLRFQLDHALARDAVGAKLDVPLLMRDLAARNLEAVTLQSAIPPTSGKHDRRTYLLRPDLGRRLSPASRQALEQRTEIAKP